MKVLTAIMILIALILNIHILAQDYNEVYRTIASDGEMSENFGSVVSISGNIAIVGAYNDSEDETGSDSLYHAGSAYLFERDEYGNWHEIQKIVASDRSVNDLFGMFVSISGNYAIVGVPWDDSDASGEDNRNSAGSAYIFERDGTGTWHEAQKIVASDRNENDFFGATVAICGGIAIIGAYFEDEDISGSSTLNNAGSAYIFERDNNGNWNQVQKIIAADRQDDDNFGVSAAISGDYAIVGAYQEDEDTSYLNPLECAGSVYIFRRNNAGIWNEIQKLVASDRGEYDHFGNSVDISGEYIIVGAYTEAEDEEGNDTRVSAGSTYIFEPDGTGKWQAVQKIVASDRDEFDLFGIEVGISGDMAIVGAYNEDEDSAGENRLHNAGSAYIFRREKERTWSQLQKIVASDRAVDNCFGVSVDISDNYIIAGTNYNSSNPEAIYLFESCEPSTETDPDNIIENGDFGSCILSPWQTYVFDPAENKVNAVLVDEECRLSDITLSNPPEIWHIQLLQTLTEEQKNRLESGATYELSFDAVGESAKDVYVFFGQNEGGPWTACVNETIAVGTEKGHFSFEFTLNSVLPLMRVLFGVGHETASLTIDNVRLVKRIPSADNEWIVTDPVLHIYPNPAHDLIQVETTIGSEVKIINMLGTVMKTLPVTDKVISMDIHELPEGMYLIKIVKDNFVSLHKIIIQ
jgi:hypothetical protein